MEVGHDKKAEGDSDETDELDAVVRGDAVDKDFGNLTIKDD